MINLDNAVITLGLVHKVGNSYAGEPSVFSPYELDLPPQEMLEIKKILTRNFKSPIKASQFVHPVDLRQNVLWSLAQDVFADQDSLLLNSRHVVNYLYEQSTHYSIKSGEVFVMYFKDVLDQDELSDAIGIFKIENSTSFIRSDVDEGSIHVFVEKGIAGRNVEKGCLIFNSEKDRGYVVYSYEKNNSDTNYWNKNFLSIARREDSFNATSTLLESYRDFVLNDLPAEQVSKKEKIELIHKSIAYVNECEEELNVPDFIQSTLGDTRTQNQYKQYLDHFSEAYEVELPEQIPVSRQAIKYQQKKFRSIIKLDKNFHIYVHANENLLEQGVDEHGRKFYKLYYEEES